MLTSRGFSSYYFDGHTRLPIHLRSESTSGHRLLRKMAVEMQSTCRSCDGNWFCGKETR